MGARQYDEWTIKRWRATPRARGLDFEEPMADDPAPPLWKDLMLASIAAVLLWALVAALLTM
jgi:hypothetical protein